MDIEYVTHASIYLRSQGVSLLTDPFYVFEEISGAFLRHFPPREISADSFGKIDYVYSSHIHLDHSHPETLVPLRKYIGTVLLPAQRPALEKRYRDLGFDDIVLLENGRTYQLPGGVEVTSFWSDPVDSALIATVDGKTIFHQNDCCLTPEVVKEIAARFTIDYAFTWYTSSQSLCPMILPRSPQELDELAQAREDRNYLNQLECIATLRPRVVIPYSMTMTYINTDQIWLNGIGRLTPVTFKERLLESRPEQECWIMQPGDVISTETDEIQRLSTRDYWGRNLDEYLSNIESYSATTEGVPRLFANGDMEEVHADIEAHFRDRLKKPFAPHIQGRVVALHIQADEGKQRSYYLDTAHEALFVDPAERDQIAEPLLEMTMPGKVAQWLMERKWDPFHILFVRRVDFSIRAALDMTVEDETLLYIYSLVSVFDYDLQLDPSEVTRLLQDSRILEVTSKVEATA
ncbi:MAG: MBL fold metallo-hydrolase [Proteobacteria bacterium]|nr:MBL fold metallo-hydrolase [Pseudomonadota bacterium]